jgi:hypothetical protein
MRYCARCPHTESDHKLGPLVGCSLGMTDPGCACCLGVEDEDEDIDAEHRCPTCHRIHITDADDESCGVYPEE